MSKSMKLCIGTWLLRVLSILLATMSLAVAYSTAFSQTPSMDPAALASAAAAASPSAVENSSDVSGSAMTPEQLFRWLQEQDKRSELIGLVVAMILALLIVLFFIRKNVDHTAEQVVRACGLVLVIFGTLFISVYASTADQLTAPIGILGAIAGYLFGSAQRRTTSSSAGGKSHSLSHGDDA